MYALVGNMRSKTTAYDAATQALLDQATTDGYTAANGTALTALDTFISTLKSDGIWTLLDALWLPATNGDSDFACYNLKDPTTFKLTKVNSPTFTSLEGFTGNGTSSYLNTNYSPSTDGINIDTNDISVGAYVRSVGGSGILVGSQNTTGNTNGILLPDSSALRLVSSGFISSSASAGFYQIDRAVSVDIKQYQDGTNTATNTITITNYPSQSLFIGARNQEGTANVFSTAQVSMAYVSSTINGKFTEFYNAIQAYMTAIGKQV